MRVRVAGSPAGSWRRSSAWTTYVPLDHLVHEIRWSNGTQVVQPHASGPSGPAASRHARHCPTMRDDRRAEWSGAPEPPLVGCGRPLSRRDVRPALESSGRNRLLESEIHSRCQEAPGARHRDPRGRAPGGRSRGPARPIGMPPWSSSGSRRPSRGPQRRGLSKSVAKARVEPRCTRKNVDIPHFLPWSIPARSAFATDLDTPRPGPSQEPHPHHGCVS